MNPIRSAHTASISAIAFALLGALAATSPAVADTEQARIRLSPIHKQGIVLPVSGPEHVIYGQITALRLPYFQMKLRSGRVITINAKPAIDADRYSVPFFIGKFVLVTGKMDTSKTIQADTVTRQTRIDAATAFDR